MGTYKLPKPALVVVLALVLFLDPPMTTIIKTSSRPKAAYFAAAVERSLYFVFAVAVVLAAACSALNQTKAVSS